MNPAPAALLGVIETLLSTPLQAALGNGIDIISGPALPPASLSQPRLCIHASSLRSLPAPGADYADYQDATPERERVWRSRRLLLKADAGQPGHFSLPPEVQVAEVSVAPGRILRTPDDYLLQNQQILLMGTPLPELNIITRGVQAAGYREKTQCQIELWLEVLAADSPRADALSHEALLISLATLAAVEQLDLSGASQQDSNLRLLKLLARADQIERQCITLGSGAQASMAVRSLGKIAIRAELELNLVLGDHTESGRIESIEIKQL